MKNRNSGSVGFKTSSEEHKPEQYNLALLQL